MSWLESRDVTAAYFGGGEGLALAYFGASPSLTWLCSTWHSKTGDGKANRCSSV